MKFIKKHPKEFILLIIAVVIVIICLVAFLLAWFAGSNNSYGDRLDGIEKVQLEEKYLDDIKNKIKSNDCVEIVTHNLQGRLLSYIVTVNDNTSKEDAKKLSDIVIKEMKEDELKYYDIQLYIIDSKKNKDSFYPIIGYKHKTEDVFIWSNN